jgi:DNA-binding Lrp family transcriptional regulator
VGKMIYKVDKVDKQIISELIENPKLSAKTLGKKLNLHPNTLLQRIKRLENKGVIRGYTTIVDYTKLGYEMQAIVFIKTIMEDGWEEEIKPISDFPEVSSFMFLSLDHDAAIILRVKDMEELSKTLKKIQANKVVLNTTTHMILDYYKFPHEFNRLKDEII